MKLQGTVEIPDLHGLFQGAAEVEVTHLQGAQMGWQSRVGTTIRMTGLINSAHQLRLMDRFLDSPKLEGYIDDRPFEFWGVEVEMEQQYLHNFGGDPVPYGRMVTVRMHATPREPKLHPVVAARRRRMA